MNQVVERITSILVARFRERGPQAFNLEQELNFIDPVTERSLNSEEREHAKKELLKIIQYKQSHDGARLIPVSVVSDPKLHEEWYPTWIEENNDVQRSYYWKRLEDFLSHELSRKYSPATAGTVVRSIDEATYKIMEKLANPARHDFSYKGLVVGYVQSGKTANFTALIAKSADAGYKFIIVLAGIHNVLRRQTQVRLDRELTGEVDIETDESYISLPGAAKRWNRLTTARNDFSTTNLGPFSSFCQWETPTLAVVKKNVSVLNKLIDYISLASEDLRANLPVLIIDDEADQASIDTNAGNSDPDIDPSRTNACIRRLLGLFSRKAYVGYTATPFANVLIDMATEHDQLQDDLYPRNFVVSLPEPEGYFGTSQIFHGSLSERFVTPIPNEIVNLISYGEMTTNLSNAIDEFILCCAVRNLRGDRMKPMSMLVHVTHRIEDMRNVHELITAYVTETIGRYRKVRLKPALKNQYQQVWGNFSVDAEAINTELGLGNRIPDFEQIWAEVEQVFNALCVLELNSDSDDELDYTTGDEIKVIAVGGNQLSRGLTLEGLMTSYYLRESRQYDTLLQMGRWFGYRRTYEDLTRVHTTHRIWDFFEHMALVEQELRSAIYQYEENNLTPVQMAVAIRDHRTLNITARNKMGAGQAKQTSFSQSLNQTTWFNLDQPEILRANLRLGNSFIRRVKDEFGFPENSNSGVYLSHNKVPGDLVLRDFLNRYAFVARDRILDAGLDSEALLQYISRRLNHSNPELTEWSIAVVGNTEPKFNNDPEVYGGLSVNRVGRSRKFTRQGYSIGVLTESDHLKIDLEEGASSPYDGRGPQNPLLLLYLVSKDSRARGAYNPQPQFNERVDLYRDIQTEKVDLLGIAIVLPKSIQEPNSFIGQ